MDPFAVQQRSPKFRDRIWLHATLFLLTLATTTLVGAGHYVSFLSDFAMPVGLPMPRAALLVRGLWYSGTILGILGLHELGHYLACRYYDVDASLPFFLPMPLFFFTGTLGAFIRIREPIPQKRMLFDIGIAGPIAGFLIAVPALFAGLAMSHVVPTPASLPQGSAELGEPLLFQFATWVLWGHIRDGYTLNLHPVAFASWFGLLATALNLMPVGQLDGGHLSYAVLGRSSSRITLGVIGIGLLLGFFASSWFVWSALMIAMLFFFGRHHPPVFDEAVALDPTRRLLAVVALLMLVVCFTPAPIRPLDVIGR